VVGCRLLTRRHELAPKSAHVEFLEDGFVIHSCIIRLTLDLEKTKQVLLRFLSYLLLLRSGIVKSVPCNFDYFLIVLPIWILIIPYSSTRVLCPCCSKHLVGKRGETGREMAAEFCPSVSLLYPRRSLTCRTILHGADGFTSPPKKIVYGFLLPLKSIALGQFWTHEPCVQWDVFLTHRSDNEGSKLVELSVSWYQSTWSNTSEGMLGAQRTWILLGFICGANVILICDRSNSIKYHVV
jgi:hypothetical protein